MSFVTAMVTQSEVPEARRSPGDGGEVQQEPEIGLQSFGGLCHPEALGEGPLRTVPFHLEETSILKNHLRSLTHLRPILC